MLKTISNFFATYQSEGGLEEPQDTTITVKVYWTILGLLFGFLFPVIASVFEMYLQELTFSLKNLWIAQRSNPILWIVDLAPFVLGFVFNRVGNRELQLLQSNKSLDRTIQELQKLQTELETRVEERTLELEVSAKKLQKRANQFETIAQLAAQLAQNINSIQSLESILQKITQLVSVSFDFYHVGLFLLDASRQYAVLNAANSQGGQKMLDRKHRLKVGSEGIVGYATSTGNPRVALDTGIDAVYFDNPDLPETRSEMALPLRVGSTVVGALDIQSTVPNAFSEDDVEVLSILADVVSVAIENARLYDESQRVLADAQSAFGEFTQDAWKQMVTSRKVVGYELSGTTIRSLEEPIIANGSAVSVPIKLRELVIGNMNISLPDNKKLDQDELDITQALAQRIGIAIETATLLAETQKSAVKEQMISEITGKIGSSINLRNVLQTAVEELGQAIPGSEIVIQLEQDRK